MTDPGELTLSWSTPQPGVTCVTLVGDLDHGSADTLADEVGRTLRGTGEVRELRIDCAGVGYCDSYGLSSLLMVRRHAAATGAVLRLDHRSPSLERLLRITNTLGHLTGDGGLAREEQYDR